MPIVLKASMAGFYDTYIIVNITISRIETSLIGCWISLKYVSEYLRQNSKSFFFLILYIWKYVGHIINSQNNIA